MAAVNRPLSRRYGVKLSYLEVVSLVASDVPTASVVAVSYPVNCNTVIGSSITVPMATLSAQGHDSAGDNAAYIIAPSAEMRLYSGAAATAKSPISSVAASGTVTGLTKVDILSPAPLVQSSATVSGMASCTITAAAAHLIGYSGAVCSITLTGKSTLQATGTTTGLASVTATCPLFELSASGTAQNHGGANLIAPSPKLGGQAQAWLVAPGAVLSAIGSAVVAATYEAYAVNLNHTPTPNVEPVDEMTRYTNFPFTHVVRYQNSYYGANETGLYLLEGTTDDSVPIEWSLTTALSDLKSPMLKNIPSAYFSGRFGPATTVQLRAGEDEPNVYEFQTPRDQQAQNHRQLFGKGVRDRYYALGLNGTDTLELDEIDLSVTTLSRRI